MLGLAAWFGGHVALLAGLGLYDLYLIRRSGVEASITHEMREFCQHYPIVPFLYGFVSGVLAGHFFWWQ